MNRPYIICHMLQSIDGRISGQFFHDENTQNLSSIYKEMSNQFTADGIIYGSVTAKEIFTYGNPKQIHTDSKQNIEKEDFIVENENKEWIVVFDPQGTLNWKEQSLNNPRLIGKNVVVILLNNVSMGYLDHLKELGISYILGGETKVDLHYVMDILYTKCKIKKLLLQGGGILNGSFVNENLVDEISLIIAPDVSASNKAVLCFETSSYSKQDIWSQYIITDTKILSCSGVWLHYKKRI